jgi:hypothetical protein
MWANRSPQKRKAVGAAITAGQLRYWAAHPEMRAVRGAASKAGKARGFSHDGTAMRSPKLIG